MERRNPQIEGVVEFARLSAELSDPFCERASVLKARGLDEARWESTSQTYRALIAADAASGNELGLGAHFRDAFLKAKEDRARNATHGHEEPSLAMRAEPSHEPEPAPAPPAAAQPPRVTPMPSYLQQQASPPRQVGFGIGIGVPLRHAALDGERRSTQGTPAPVPAVPLAQPSTIPVPRVPAGLVSTALTDPALEKAVAMVPLPFKAPKEPPPSRKPSGEIPRQGGAIASGTTLSDGTKKTSPKTLPFSRDAHLDLDLGPTGWTIERYAELGIDMYASGRPPDEVLASVGLTRRQYETLENHWTAEMDKDNALRDRWALASSQRRKQLSQRSGNKNQ